MKIAFLITTRGNYGKTKTIIDNLDCEVIKYEPKLREPIDDCADDLSYIAYSNLLLDRPDCLVLVGDRWELLPYATQAYLKGIPIAHIEGGETSGNMDEGIRHAVSKLASIHFPATQEAAKRLERLGEDPNNIYVVGATSFDLIEKHKDDEMIGIFDDHIIFIYHPCKGEDWKEVLHARNKFDEIVIWIEPNIDIGSSIIRIDRTFSNVPIEVYASYLNKAKCIVGNSSSGIREAGFLGTPCVNVGKRQNTRQRGENVLDVPCERQAIQDAIKYQIEHGRYGRDYSYGYGNSGKKIAKILQERLEKGLEVQKTWHT